MQGVFIKLCLQLPTISFCCLKLSQTIIGNGQRFSKVRSVKPAIKFFHMSAKHKVKVHNTIHFSRFVSFTILELDMVHGICFFNLLEDELNFATCTFNYNASWLGSPTNTCYQFPWFNLYLYSCVALMFAGTTLNLNSIGYQKALITNLINFVDDEFIM